MAIKKMQDFCEEHGIGVGFDDEGLESFKVADLCESGVSFVIYNAKKMPSAYEDSDEVYIVQIGDPKGVNGKVWIGNTVLMGKLDSLVQHDGFPVSTKIVKKKGKSHEYYDFV
jgi:hypothetical protein